MRAAACSPGRGQPTLSHRHAARSHRHGARRWSHDSPHGQPAFRRGQGNRRSHQGGVGVWSRSRGSEHPQRRAVRLLIGGVVLAGGLGLSACSSGSSSASAQITQWVNTNGFGSSVGTLLGDGGRIIEAVESNQAPGVLRTDCGLLEDDASSAAGNLPTPDQALTDALEGAYKADLVAANECYSSHAAGAQRLKEAVGSVTKADALLEQAVQQVSSATGRVPSTTTTTSPGGDGDALGF